VNYNGCNSFVSLDASRSIVLLILTFLSPVCLSGQGHWNMWWQSTQAAIYQLIHFLAHAFIKGAKIWTLWELAGFIALTSSLDSVTEDGRWQHRGAGLDGVGVCVIYYYYYSASAAVTRQLHCIWLRCAYQSQQFSGDMVYGQQYAEIWRSHDVIWQDMDKGASTSLDHHCGTLCCWLFVTRHWL